MTMNFFLVLVATSFGGFLNQFNKISYYSLLTSFSFQPLCIANVVLVYYFSTSVYTCMLVEGLHICIKLKTVFATAFGTKKHVICLFVAWGKNSIICALYFFMKFMSLKSFETEHKICFTHLFMIFFFIFTLYFFFCHLR